VKTKNSGGYSTAQNNAWASPCKILTEISARIKILAAKNSSFLAGEFAEISQRSQNLGGQKLVEILAEISARSQNLIKILAEILASQNLGGQKLAENLA